MKVGRHRPPSTEALAAYLEDELPLTQRRELEAELAGSPEASARLAQLRAIRDGLKVPLPGIEDIDLVGRLQDCMDAAPTSPPARQVRPTRQAWVGLAAALAALAVLYPGHLPTSSESEFRAKSMGSTDLAEAAGASFQVYRVRHGTAPEAVGTRIAPDDGLLFAYSNGAASDFEFLSIFAIDASRRVRWFFPAYENSGDAVARSIAIERGVADAVLPDIVEHDFAPGPMTIYALFARRAFFISDVEAWVEAGSLRVPPHASADVKASTMKVVVTQ